MSDTTNTKNTENTENKAPVADDKVVSGDNAPKPSVNKEEEAALEDIKRVKERDLKAKEYTQALETSGQYHDLGCFYAANTPVPAAFGAEVGVVTKDQKTGVVQRTGIGLYIRSDHAAGCQYDLTA